MDINITHTDDRLARAAIPGCADCIRKSSCLGHDLDRSASFRELSRIQHPRPLRQGQHVYRPGDAGDGIFLVRCGAFKAYSLDRQGETQVLGFHLPGEIFGIEGFLQGHHGHFVQALDTASICRLPLSLSQLDRFQAGRMDVPLLRIMGEVLARDHRLILSLNKMTAQRKLASFLVDLVTRLRSSDVEQAELTLAMARADIANYLGLAIETISRLLTQLQTLGLIRVQRRELKVCDLHALRALASEQGHDPVLDKVG